MLCGDRNIEISKLIVKARGLNFDIKTQNKWKYSDRQCSGCQIMDRSGDEILFCKSFGINIDKFENNWFFSDSVSNQIEVAKLIRKQAQNLCIAA